MLFVAQCTLEEDAMHSGKKPQSILVKSDDSPFYIFFLNPVYVAARSLRSLRSNKRENEFSKSSLFTRILCGFLPEFFAAFYQNAWRLFTRMHCAFYQSALRHEQHEVVTLLWWRLFFCEDCSWDRLVVMVCFDLPVKRCERDRAWLSQPLLLSSMQNLKVWKSGRLIVTS